MNTCTFCGCDGHIRTFCESKKQCTCPGNHRFSCSKCNWSLFKILFFKKLPYIPVEQRSQENRQLAKKEHLMRNIHRFQEAGDYKMVESLKKKLATDFN